MSLPAFRIGTSSAYMPRRKRSGGVVRRESKSMTFLRGMR